MMLGLDRDKPIKFFEDDHHSICCEAPVEVREMIFWGKDDKPFTCSRCHRALGFD
mgnify:CR=1 FL=1